MGESCIGIEVTVELCELCSRRVGWRTFCSIEPYHLGAENASGEIASIGYEVYAGFQMTLQLGERLSYLVKMLMGENLIGAEVVGTP